MKKTVAFMLSLLFAGTAGLAMADTAAPAAAPAPAMHPHPRIHEVRTRIEDQLKRIKAGLKSGKLTADQAKALRDVLKSVRAQMQADFQTNGKKELTEDQLKQLNQMLDDNSKNIFDEKHPDGSAPAGGSSSTGSTGSSTGASAPVS